MIYAAIVVACLTPLAVLIWQWNHHQLGINSIEYVARYTGDWTLRLLLATLAVTPLRRLFAFSARYRRTLGLFAFFYGCLHLTHYVWRDKMFFWPEIWEDFRLRRFYTAGLVAFALMIPLAATSSSAAIRRLGGRRWRMLHRLVYVSAAAGVVHYLWQGKSILPPPVIYGGVLAVLLAARIRCCAGPRPKALS